MSTYLIILLVYILGFIPFIKIIMSYENKSADASRAGVSEGLKYSSYNKLIKFHKGKLKKTELVLLEKIRKEADDNAKLWKSLCGLYFIFGAIFVFHIVDGKIFNITLFNY